MARGDSEQHRGIKRQAFEARWIDVGNRQDEGNAEEPPSNTPPPPCYSHDTPAPLDLLMSPAGAIELHRESLCLPYAEAISGIVA